MLKIIVPDDIIDELKTILKKNGENEIGGIIFGEKISSDCFRIVQLTSQSMVGNVFSFIRQWGYKTVHTFSRFFKQTAYQYTKYNYLGEWHSHPSFSTEPSSTDIETMNRLVRYEVEGANFLVLLIVKLNGISIQANAKCFLKNGCMENVQLILEETNGVC